MQVSYQAVDIKGRASHDVIDAPSTQDAVEMLRRRGLFVTKMEQGSVSRPTVQSHRKPGEKRLSVTHLALFTRQMAMLLKAGSGVVPAIAAIRRQMRRPAHAALLTQLISDLEDGTPFTEALRKHPTTFDPVYGAIVAAGEASGALGKMFERLAEIVGKRRALQRQIKGALAYPILLVAMCVKIICVMLLFVLPRFAGMFDQLGVQPPATTVFLLTLGQGLRSYWYLLLLAVLGLVGGAIWLVKSPIGRQAVSNLQTRIPFVGRLRAQMIQAQILRTMGMLLESRVGLLETMDLARQSTRNREFQKFFNDMSETVTCGGQISSAVDRCGLIEPYVGQAVRTGEESGNLAGAMIYCADVLDESNAELLHTVMKLIEPAILILMGLVVGGVAVSLFLPLFDLTSAIQ